ncbi:MAG: hypothetical protein ACPHRO_05100 [Nannocystaceae bacterium]
MRRRRHLYTRVIAAAGLTCATLFGYARSAQAWDPTSIHIPLTERAALDSDLQVRWMDASDAAFGLFSGVRLDPSLLSTDERVLIFETLTNLPSSAGARPLGGPGACPPPGSPEQTQRYCVEGDLWELDALGRLRFGVLAESSPPDRVSQHFFFPSHDLESETSAPRLHDSLPQRTQRRLRTAGTSRFIGLNPTRQRASARAWYENQDGVLSPAQFSRHLELAATSPTNRERQHHLAMALICAGALGHVLQDLAVPAHARGDVDAFFQQLSELPGDRGLPLQEWSRVHIGKPGIYAIQSEDQEMGPPLPLRALFFHPTRGTAAVTRALHFSENTLPSSKVLSPALAPDMAARELLEDSDIDPTMRERATLTRWPADSGYVKLSDGRALFAWRRDANGVVTPFLDEQVYRSETEMLLPRALSATTQAFDWLFPAWPSADTTIERGILSFQLPEELREAHVLVAVQDKLGRRGPSQRIALSQRGPQRLVGLPIPTDAHSTSVTFIGDRPDGTHFVASRVFRSDVAASNEP